MSKLFLFTKQIFSIILGRFRAIVFASLFCFLLMAIRFYFTNSQTYIFLSWNLFLAFLPFLFSLFFLLKPECWETRKYRYLVLTAWLAFLPNSFYIVTDLIHLRHISSAPVWFDSLLIYAFAWAGIVMGVAAIQNIEKLVVAEYGRRNANAFLFVLLFLVSLGVYMGRHLRFNSWDALFDPFAIFKKLTPLFINPVDSIYVWGLVFLYGSLFYIMYKGVGSSK